MKRIILILPLLLFDAMVWATPEGNSFPEDPGTLMLKVELSAAVIDGGTIEDHEPSGAGTYPSGTSVTITAQTISGYQFVHWSDEVTDNPRTIELNESVSITAYYCRLQIEIPVAANRWTFICLPPLGDRQYTEDMFTYDGLSAVKWGTYNGAKRAAGQSGWETPTSFNALQGYIIYSSTAGTLRINAYQDEISQSGTAADTIYATMTTYPSPHNENANWNFIGNPYIYDYDITSALASMGIETPFTIWNGVGYTTFTPGIDSYVLSPLEAFFIQISDDNPESVKLPDDYIIADDNLSPGMLKGEFSVSDSTTIHFSQGNLLYQASTNTWRFADNQFDYVGDETNGTIYTGTTKCNNANFSSTYDGWIDLFGFGTSGWNSGANVYQPYIYSGKESDYQPGGSATNNLTGKYAKADWGVYNPIANGGNEAGLWRTLSYAEWDYLINTRENAGNLRGQATVNDIYGYIFLPDNWRQPNELDFNAQSNDWTTNVYNSLQWRMMESSGAVFLPCVGYSYGTSMYNVGTRGDYWSTTASSTYYAYGINFTSSALNIDGGGSRCRGRAVRLVR